jgi:hypothetical protein
MPAVTPGCLVTVDDFGDGSIMTRAPGNVSTRNPCISRMYRGNVALVVAVYRSNDPGWIESEAFVLLCPGTLGWVTLRGLVNVCDRVTP